MVKGMWPGQQVEVKGICMEFPSRSREREEVLKGTPSEIAFGVDRQ